MDQVWNSVTTVDELEAFLRVVGGFHDGIIKEVHWVNRDSIAENLMMTPYTLSDARMLVQRQWREPSAVEIVFESIWRLKLETVGFVFSTTAGTEESSVELGPSRQLLTLDFENAEVAFERMKWRDASDWMGPDLRFGTGIPALD